jgi:hypothetical protein
MPAASTGAASQLRPSATRFHGPEPIEQAIFEPRQSMLQPPNPRGGRLDYSLFRGDDGVQNWFAYFWASPKKK